MIRCPVCNGTGEVSDDTVRPSPVPLSRLQYRVWDIVRRCPDGIRIGPLVDMVYANCHDGRPIHARTSVHVTIHNTNRRLAAANQRIVSTRGRGSIYMLQHLDDGK